MATIITHPPEVAGGATERIRRPRRHYTCAYCQKVFKRSEHCIRHERTHTNEKPFSCRYCRRSYSRKDLVTRHERTLHAQGQAEPSALPLPGIPAEGDCSSDGSVSEKGGRRRSRDDTAAFIAADDTELPPSESEPSPVSSLIRGAIDSPPKPPPTATLDEGVTNSVAGETQARQQGRYQERPQHRPLSSHVSAVDGSHPASAQPDVYSGLQFGIYDASSQVPMDIDHDRERRNPDEYTSLPEQNPPQEQSQQQHAHELYPFSQYHDSGAQANAMNANLDPSLFAAFEPTDMTSFFAFSPFPGGLFDVGQTMPNIPISGIAEYNTLLNPTPSASRLDAAVSPASAPAAHSPPQLMTSKHKAGSSVSDTSFGRELPSHLPLVVKDEPPKIPNLAADANWHDSLCKDLGERLGRPGASQEVPSANLLQGFLASFLDSYYRHQPLIHLPTMSTVDTPSPLVLAMCCIGALYRLDRRRAQRLYTLGIESVAGNVRRFITESEELPLWVGQTKMLLTAYAALSGDKGMAATVMEENGFHTMLYEKMRLALAAEDPDINKMTWETWIRRESWKRLLVGIYVASTIHIVIWDINPGFNTSRDLEIEVLHDEALWNAKTASEWAELRANQTHQDYRTLKDGLASIMSDSKPDSPRITACRLSPFTAHLLMHAVVVHVWQLVQVAQTLSPGGLGRDPVSSLLMNSAVRSLARSHELLVSAEEPAGSSSHEEGTSQIFNCQATLRMAYIRLFSVANGFDRPSLMTASDPAAVKAFASNFAITKLDRSPPLFDAVVKAFEGLRIPVRMGHMLVRKTAALRWSPAHAIAGWDCALFVCKWVHSVEMDRLNDIEPTPAESEFLETIKDVLEEAEDDSGKSRSLAAGVARTWSWLLQDVWVWSITPRMGAVLEQIAAAFERVHDANRRPGA